MVFISFSVSDAYVYFLDAVTQILVVFTKMFKKSRDENEQQADAERKKLEKEALKEQAAASSSGKKEVDTDRMKLNFRNQLNAVWSVQIDRAYYTP